MPCMIPSLIFDALVSKRPYKEPFSYEKAREIISQGDDRINPHIHIDPQVHKLFIKHFPLFVEIHEKLKDE